MIKRRVDLVNKQIKEKEELLLETMLENDLIITTFNNNTKHRLYQLSLTLLNIKLHYENLLKMTDEYVNHEEYIELQELIMVLDDQLKEIGILSNKGDVETSIIEKIYYVNKDCKHFKN